MDDLASADVRPNLELGFAGGEGGRGAEGRGEEWNVRRRDCRTAAQTLGHG